MKTLFNLAIETRQTEGETVAEVTIDGVIGEDFFQEGENTKQKMREQLREIDAIDADRIVVNISSLGGDVDHGLAIHDLLASNPAPVETNVIGMTASAATIIAQAGNTRKMSDNALYLIHKAWTMGMGNANDFEALTNDLRKLDERIANIYSKRSGFDKSAFEELMNESNGDGIWISAEEAKDFGLIDEITEPMKAAACKIDLDAFRNSGVPIPEQLIHGSTYFDGALSQDDIEYIFQEGIKYIDSNDVPVQESIQNQNIGNVTVTIDASEIVEAFKNGLEETKEETDVSAMSRERAQLELLKLKRERDE